ncbi:hypothetical protein [Phyllobacterium myrsinacearum]|uniref:Uncharacterized protein n=1 Tax=Phyllobacterium myrsinacearum TaxID=28101 RepID=A0A839EFS5_9HYPH|nr:hypothetical protein [Phyllobacterium myrsinacearum]MBA8877238.1 hypothetical protein [Phyllobacterium myrsinacearum]
MESYNFWQDFFDTYQSLSDWLKILWLIIPPAFVLGLVALTLRFRIERRQAARGAEGELVYSIHRDTDNRVHIVSHTPLVEQGAPLLLLDPAGVSEPGRDLIRK